MFSYHLKQEVVQVFKKNTLTASFYNYFSSCRVKAYFTFRKVRMLQSWHFVKTFKGYWIFSVKILNRRRWARRITVHSSMC